MPGRSTRDRDDWGSCGRTATRRCRWAMWRTSVGRPTTCTTTRSWRDWRAMPGNGAGQAIVPGWVAGGRPCRWICPPGTLRRRGRGPSSLDDLEASLPARLGEQVGDLVPDAADLVRHGRPLPGIPVLVVRPPDHERPALDVIARHETPRPAVFAVVAVVPHAEQGVLGDAGRRVIVLIEIQSLRIAVNLVFLLDRLAVDVHLPVADLEHLTRQPDHPLDVILLGLLRVLEHDDVAALQE